MIPFLYLVSSRFNFYESYLILKFLTLFFFYHYYAHECDTSFSISSISISSFSISSFSISSVLLLLLLLLLILLIYHPIQSSLYFNTFFHAHSLFYASSLSSLFFFILFYWLISLFFFFLLISLFFFIRFWSYSFLPLYSSTERASSLAWNWSSQVNYIWGTTREGQGIRKSRGVVLTEIVRTGRLYERSGGMKKIHTFYILRSGFNFDVVRVIFDFREYFFSF